MDRQEGGHYKWQQDEQGRSDDGPVLVWMDDGVPREAEQIQQGVLMAVAEVGVVDIAIGDGSPEGGRQLPVERGEHGVSGELHTPGKPREAHHEGRAGNEPNPPRHKWECPTPCQQTCRLRASDPNNAQQKTQYGDCREWLDANQIPGGDCREQEESGLLGIAPAQKRMSGEYGEEGSGQVRPPGRH